MTTRLSYELSWEEDPVVADGPGNVTLKATNAGSESVRVREIVLQVPLGSGATALAVRDADIDHKPSPPAWTLRNDRDDGQFPFIPDKSRSSVEMAPGESVEFGLTLDVNREPGVTLFEVTEDGKTALREPVGKWPSGFELGSLVLEDDPSTVHLGSDITLTWELSTGGGAGSQPYDARLERTSRPDEWDVVAEPATSPLTTLFSTSTTYRLTVSTMLPGPSGDPVAAEVRRQLEVDPSFTVRTVETGMPQSLAVSHDGRWVSFFEGTPPQEPSFVEDWDPQLSTTLKVLDAFSLKISEASFPSAEHLVAVSPVDATLYVMAVRGKYERGLPTTPDSVTLYVLKPDALDTPDARLDLPAHHVNGVSITPDGKVLYLFYFDWTMGSEVVMVDLDELQASSASGKVLDKYDFVLRPLYRDGRLYVLAMKFGWVPSRLFSWDVSARPPAASKPRYSGIEFMGPVPPMTAGPDGTIYANETNWDPGPSMLHAIRPTADPAALGEVARSELHHGGNASMAVAPDGRLWVGWGAPKLAIFTPHLRQQELVPAGRESSKLSVLAACDLGVFVHDRVQGEILLFRASDPGHCPASFAVTKGRLLSSALASDKGTLFVAIAADAPADGVPRVEIAILSAGPGPPAPSRAHGRSEES